MPTVRRDDKDSDGLPPKRLPQRWAIIVIISTIAGASADAIGGPTAALAASIGIAAALHSLIE
ncbi:hypothetical protein Aple_073790 [Acrocarpospora pleiomorpha]|uniref:Uncharacterized protein n=1 Tax=Acrocarpospora pleiomorpha TaxID=90975 RepID=A0A5M3XUC0_9ACTN|nr:hypothetical protein [Acrocarpospora pleiomorpha]GES24480.1 hypothetical protein Aple_073790 [Acrocarpospora pleiomorpha]